MLQDIYPEILDNSYLITKPEDDDLLVIIRDQKVLFLCNGQNIQFPKIKEFKNCMLQTVYLLKAGGCRFFALEYCDTADDLNIHSKIEALCSKGYAFYDILSFMNHEPQWLCFAAATAYQLSSWYLSNRFCGRCGGKLEKGLQERSLFCSNCKNTIYPKINPAVIAAVTKGDQILLTQYAKTSYNERYALIAGYCEIGETVEDTVRREVMEETGVCVKNIRFYKSQPWPLSDTLLLGFYCQLDGQDKIVMDESELKTAKWVHRDDIPEKTDDGSLTYHMIMNFKRENGNYETV